MKKFINAVIYGHDDASEILVEDGVIKAIGKDLGPADKIIDLGGKLVTPPYVDPHIHLDYVYTLTEMGQRGASSGTLFEAIELWPKFKANLTVEGVKRLALKYDKLIDVHCDETDDPQSRFVELLNALVLMEDYGTRTTASHTCSFGSADDSYAYRTMDLFKKSRINFIACPTENAYLQGRHDTYPKRRGLTRVKEFMENGINVAFAQDSINDPWYPLGNGNMMNILDNGIHLAQIMSPEEIERDLDLITYNGAICMNIQDRYGLEVGKDANFIVLDGNSPFDVIRRRAGVLASIRRGEYLFKKKPVEYEVELDLEKQIWDFNEFNKRAVNE